ncbi:MAG: hypothetical protein EZS28_026746 [Streblomastix strix]|uniref:DDE-1 domain-containing protein n=1 Tax=Streblomastix strix TaxID=222440 RepID=A0A5J4V544_9EUKA|nr:MAG: hypothetical protein EZS28_026746 [Streblomastix strix]
MTQFARNLPNHLKQNDAKKIILRIEVRNPKTFKELIHQADEEIRKILKKKGSQKILSAVFILCKQTISAYLKPGKPGFWRERMFSNEEEKEMVAEIKRRRTINEPFSMNELLDWISQNYRRKPLTKGFYRRFKKRHEDELKEGVARPIDQARVNIKLGQIKTYVGEANDSIVEVHPAFFYSTDEEGHTELSNARSKTVIVPKECKTSQLFYKINRSCPHVTGMPCIALQQKSAPPLICLPGKRQLVNAYPPGLTKGTDLQVAVTPKSYVNTDTLEKYIDESFIPFIEQRREKMHMPYAPATMLCDNHGPHVADEIQAKLAASNIRLLTVPPHSTHVTQPLDLVTFSAVKGDLPPRKGAHMPKSKIEKVKLMYQVLEKHTTSSTNESAFRKAGYSAVTEKKVQKVKIDESKLISNYAKFMDIDEKVARKQYDEANVEEYPKYGYLNRNWIEFYQN